MIKLIVGKRGSGKTSLINAIIKDSNKKVLIVDYNYEYLIPHFSLLDLYEQNPFISYKAIAVSIEVSNFDLLSGILLAKYSNLLFIVDELDIFDSPISNNTYWKRLLHIGRHKDIDIIGATRRVYAVNRLFTSQVDYLYCFRTNEPRDIKYISEYVNNIDYVNLIQKLKQYHYAVIKV